MPRRNRLSSMLPTLLNHKSRLLACGLAFAGLTDFATYAVAQVTGNHAQSSPVQSSTVQSLQPRHLEIAVELELLTDPITFPHALAARVQGSAMSVRGYVPTEAVRDRAVSVAQKACSLPVQDGIIVQANALAAIPSSAKERLKEAALARLEKAGLTKTNRIDVAAGQNGQITLTGLVATLEEKLLCSRCLRTLSGCTSVKNELEAADAPKPIPPRATSSTLPARVYSPSTEVKIYTSKSTMSKLQAQSVEVVVPELSPSPPPGGFQPVVVEPPLKQVAGRDNMQELPAESVGDRPRAARTESQRLLEQYIQKPVAPSTAASLPQAPVVSASDSPQPLLDPRDAKQIPPIQVLSSTGPRPQPLVNMASSDSHGVSPASRPFVPARTAWRDLGSPATTGHAPVPGSSEVVTRVTPAKYPTSAITPAKGTFDKEIVKHTMLAKPQVIQTGEVQTATHSPLIATSTVPPPAPTPTVPPRESMARTPEMKPVPADRKAVQPLSTAAAQNLKHRIRQSLSQQIKDVEFNFNEKGSVRIAVKVLNPNDIESVVMHIAPLPELAPYEVSFTFETDGK